MPTMPSFVATYQVQLSFYFDETQRLLELAGAVPAELYRAQHAYSHASMHETFVHLRGATQLWRCVLSGAEPVRLSADEIPDVAALTALLAVERSGWHALLAGYDDTTLLGTVERETPFGVVQLPIWQTVQHVILHGMTHLTEIARMLSDAGQQPGDVDFLFYTPG